MAGTQRAGNGTLRQTPQTPGQNNDQSAGRLTRITLGGTTFDVDEMVSASTGEAQVYRLRKGGNTYALKLYYAGMEPDEKVTSTLKAISGTGFIVDIIDYGRWTSPQGEARFYELMPFYSGGALAPGSLAGKPEALKAVAAAMMIAVKAAHDHGLLHKDIKPQNFLYTDTTRSQLALSDFGIASPFKRDSRGRMLPLKINAQWRTKIYAAPEIYTVIDNEIEYADDRSDYYSLGISLLTLWSGESALAALGERKLLSLKRGESGTLPYPSDMPAPLLRLVKGLTVPLSAHRWGFEEFERWAKGENVPVHGEKPQAPPTEFNILYNGSKGQRATSRAQLAAFMMEDKKLAAQYLYSGQMARWMREAGHPELEAQLNDFTTRLYPANREAGVLAAAYLLDVDLPFASPSGKMLRTQQEIAHDMTRFAARYLPMMADKDSPLYVYFRSAGVDHLASKFQPIAAKGQMDAFLALWRMIYTLDPAAEFPVFDPSLPDKYYTYGTVQQLVDFFAKLPDEPYRTTNSALPQLLYDEAFIMWLAHRDAALAGKIKSRLAQEKGSKKDLYYYIWYMLAPDRNYHMQKDQQNMFTIAQIARQANREYVGIDRDSGLPAMLKNLSANRLYYYLKAKELYKDKFDYIAYCFDLNSADRKRQAGPYNERIAMFKALKALNGKAAYYFPKSRTTVTTLDELAAVDAAEQLEQLRNGKLRDWLAVEYQEDPFADLSEEYAYEDLLGKYTCRLDDIDDEDPTFERMCLAYDKVDSAAARIRRMLMGNYIWRGIFALVVILPLLALAVLVAVKGCADFAAPSPLWTWGIVALNLTVGLRLVQSISKVRSWLLYPFGAKGKEALMMHRWLVSAIYAAVICGTCWLMEAHGNTVGRYVLAAMCVAVAAWRYKVTIKDYPLMKDTFHNAIHPDDIALKVEPLFYAWDENEAEFDSETLDRQGIYYEGIKAARYFCITRTFWSLVPMAVLLALYLPFSPIEADRMKDSDPQRWEKVYGDGKTEPTNTELNTNEMPQMQ